MVKSAFIIKQKSFKQKGYLPSENLKNRSLWLPRTLPNSP